MEYILIRFDNKPNPKVTELLFTEIVTDGIRPYAAVLPGAIMTKFESELSHDEIVEKLNTLNIKFELVDFVEATPTNSRAPRNADTARVPENPTTPEEIQLKIDQLKKQLKRAEDAEEFERAVEIRDEINELTAKLDETDEEAQSESILTSLISYKHFITEQKLIKENTDKEHAKAVDVFWDDQIKTGDFAKIDPNNIVYKNHLKSLDTDVFINYMNADVDDVEALDKAMDKALDFVEHDYAKFIGKKAAKYNKTNENADAVLKVITVKDVIDYYYNANIDAAIEMLEEQGYSAEDIAKFKKNVKEYLYNLDIKTIKDKLDDNVLDLSAPEQEIANADFLSYVTDDKVVDEIINM
jgi:hypothetical protein